MCFGTSVCFFNLNTEYAVRFEVNNAVDIAFFRNFAKNFTYRMAEIVKIGKGLDIPLQGGPAQRRDEAVVPGYVGIVPDDFPGKVWKMAVKAGEAVSAGMPLMRDKQGGRICLVSPVSGVVKEIRRGERRHIEAVVVECAKRNCTPSSDMHLDLGAMDKEVLIDALCSSGLWSMMRQRPYDIVPDPDVVPRDIFITAFDTAPLAPALISPEDIQMLEKGVEVLGRLTPGKVWLGVRFGSGISASNAEVIEYQGPHPAGNVGVQIANTKPVNKGEIVWTLDARAAVCIGKWITSGSVDFTTEVTVNGPQVENPAIIQTIVGAPIRQLLDQVRLKDSSKGRLRIISGNVLTGIEVQSDRTADDFLRYPYRQITVIEEGDKADEFMGWASLSPKKYSVKPSFISSVFKPLARRASFDARLKGGRRAMILSGEYDKVFPFDIYPEYLIKAILAKDIDKMEKLGIHEVAPEDFALPEFVDSSKLELQKIVRDGLDYLRRETM